MDRWVHTASDVALAARAMQGDLVCFDELARRYRPAAFATALQVVGDRDLAADVAQEALLQAFLSVATLRAPAAFVPWLRRVTERIAARRAAGARRRERQEEPFQEDASATAAEAEPPVVALRREQRDVVWQAVRSLEPEDAEVAVMRYLEGLTVERIAGYLGLSREGAKYRLRRAAARLRSALRGYVEEPIEEGRETIGEQRTCTDRQRTARRA